MSTDKIIYKSYYEDNKHKEIIIYNQDGLRDGEYNLFYENGRLKKRCHYISGKIDGILEIFDENGNILEEITYVNGLKEGEHNKYRNGKLVITNMYHNDRTDSCIIN